MMKNAYLTLLILINFSAYLQSQISIIDSLQSALDTAQSTQSKFRILNLLCQHTTPKDKTLAMSYARIYDSLAHSIKDTYQIGRAKVLVGSIDFMSGEYNKAAEAFLSAVVDFESIKDSSQIGSLHNNMSAVAWAQNDTMGAIRYLEQAIPFYTGSTKIRRLIINHTNLGNMLKVSGQYDEAEVYLLKAIDYIYQINLKSELGGPYAILADLAVTRKRFEQSELYCNDALKYLSPTKDAQLIAGVWRTKADVAMQMNNYEEAQKHLEEAQKIVDINNLRIIETGLISHWMEYYVKKGDFTKAFEYSERLRLTRIPFWIQKETGISPN
ncbi:MAG: tetratricopeptide repeat protein [Saprospiraceae bacterium]|nr:tetratricopeptide repeat protein [Saprospiraceae bacterium]